MNIQLDPLDWIDTLNAIAAQQNRLQTIKANIEAQAAKQQQPQQETPPNANNSRGSTNGSAGGDRNQSPSDYQSRLEGAARDEAGPG